MLETLLNTTINSGTYICFPFLAKHIGQCKPLWYISRMRCCQKYSVSSLWNHSLPVPKSNYSGLSSKTSLHKAEEVLRMLCQSHVTSVSTGSNSSAPNGSCASEVHCIIWECTHKQLGKGTLKSWISPCYLDPDKNCNVASGWVCCSFLCLSSDTLPLLRVTWTSCDSTSEHWSLVHCATPGALFFTWWLWLMSTVLFSPKTAQHR